MSVYIGPGIGGSTVVQVRLRDVQVNAFCEAYDRYVCTTPRGHDVISAYIAMDYALDQFLPPYPPQTGVQREP